MTTANDQHKKDDFMQKAGIAAGAAVVGAAVGAAAVAMTDPAIKDRVGEGLEKIKSEIEDKREELAKDIDKAKK